MQGKRASHAQATPPAPVKTSGKVSASPIHTPVINDVGDGTTKYSAMARGLGDDEDLEGRGYLRREESEVETSVGPDVEMRSVSEIEGGGGDGKETKAERNRRLTLQQLERFRRAIAANKTKQARRLNSSSRWEAKARRGEGFDSVFVENPDGSSPDALRELRIVSYPFAMWILGALLIVAASIFVDHIHQKALQNQRLAHADATVNWWKYLVAGIVYFAAAAVVANGRVETFVMDKDASTVRIRSTKPLCVLPKLRRTRCLEKELRAIVDVRVEATGEILNSEVDTRAYKVHFDFDDGTHTTTLEGRSKKKAVFRCRLIKQFLLSCAPADSPDASPLSGSGSTSGSDAAGTMMSPSANGAIVLPARSASSHLTLAVPAPLSMPAAAAAVATPSPRRIMMVAAVPSSLSQISVTTPTAVAPK